jgi:hypothetical protein
MTSKRKLPEQVIAILDETLCVLRERLLIADTLTDDELLELCKLNHAFGLKLAEIQQSLSAQEERND